MLTETAGGCSLKQLVGITMGLQWFDSYIPFCWNPNLKPSEL